MKRYLLIIVFISSLLALCLSQDCETGYTDINGLCFHEGDLGVIQKMIDNSYTSGIDLGCEDYYSWYCGSPNPQMDSPTDSWFWNVIDDQSYYFADGDGIVEPLELGLQEWNDGRLISLMCGAYIYCSLSGEIPENISDLTEIEVLRLELNYFDGQIPESICELENVDFNDYLSFDFSYNQLCPPYPDCVPDDAAEYMDTEECWLGDVNGDFLINVQDIVLTVNLVLNNEYNSSADLNSDSIINVLDIVQLVNIIIN